MRSRGQIAPQSAVHQVQNEHPDDVPDEWACNTPVPSSFEQLRIGGRPGFAQRLKALRCLRRLLCGSILWRRLWLWSA